jgi:hypothetical protein
VGEGGQLEYLLTGLSLRSLRTFLRTALLLWFSIFKHKLCHKQFADIAIWNILRPGGGADARVASPCRRPRFLTFSPEKNYRH